MLEAYGVSGGGGGSISGVSHTRGCVVYQGCVHGMVITYSTVWINRVRLPILLVVS